MTSELLLASFRTLVQPSASIIELMDLVLYLSKYKTRYPALTFDEDEEKLSYLLLAAIKREEAIMHIDGEEVRNLQAKISLNDDSTIGFFNRAKLDSIGFTTI